MLTALIASLAFVVADTPDVSPGASKAKAAAAPVQGSVPLDLNSLVTKYEYIGEVTGTASKIDKSTIHLKVPATVQATNRNRNGNTNSNSNRNSHYHSNSAIRTPKLTTKMVDQNYQLSENVVVKSTNGKEGSLSDVKSGETIRIHIVKVFVGKPGEKMEHHYEVKSIDVATVAVTGSTTSSKK